MMLSDIERSILGVGGRDLSIFDRERDNMCSIFDLEGEAWRPFSEVELLDGIFTDS
jgi:hypothetical protein